jgi:hypothetical protein
MPVELFEWKPLQCIEPKGNQHPAKSEVSNCPILRGRTAWRPQLVSEHPATVVPIPPNLYLFRGCQQIMAGSDAFLESEQSTVKVAGKVETRHTVVVPVMAFKFVGRGPGGVFHDQEEWGITAASLVHKRALAV